MLYSISKQLTTNGIHVQVKLFLSHLAVSLAMPKESPSFMIPQQNQLSMNLVMFVVLIKLFSKRSLESFKDFNISFDVFRLLFKGKYFFNRIVRMLEIGLVDSLI